MKRMIVLLAVLALTLALFTGCGRTGMAGDGSNVSTTDDGYVNGVNPAVPDDAVPDAATARDDRPETGGSAVPDSGTGMGEGAETGSGMGSDAV